MEGDGCASSEASRRMEVRVRNVRMLQRMSFILSCDLSMSATVSSTVFTNVRNTASCSSMGKRNELLPMLRMATFRWLPKQRLA